MSVRLPPGCTCLYDGDRLVRRCDQCEQELRDLTKHVRPKPPRRHGQKIVVEVVDHVPRTMTWHVIECACGWSSALHETKADAIKAYKAHTRKRTKVAA